MKKKITIIIVLLVGLALIVTSFLGCSKKSKQGIEREKEKAEISHYTCPMHPFVHEEKPGECPICHMRLVPVYRETSPAPPDAEHPLLSKERVGERSVTISTERQQLIGIKTEAAQKKAVTKEIRTVGRVAFDPELAVAQREFLEIVKNVPTLKPSAISRLKLLGMGDEEIRDLENKGKTSSDLYLPEPGESVWIYATLYQGELEIVKPGIEAEVSFPSGSNKTFTGIIRAVDPVINPMTRSARARIEIPKAGGLLRPDSYVNVSLKVDLGEAITVPKSAVIDTGTRQIAFVIHEDRHFQSRDIKIGSEVGDEVVVLDGIKEGEKVVSSATFLVDSESQLKAAVSGMGSAPSCPEGQAWDTGMAMCMPKAGN